MAFGILVNETKIEDDQIEASVRGRSAQSVALCESLTSTI